MTALAPFEVHTVAVFDGPAPGERSARGYTSDGRRVAVSLDALVPRDVVVFDGEHADSKAQAWQRRHAADIVDAALAPYGLRVNRCAAGIDAAPEGA